MTPRAPPTPSARQRLRARDVIRPGGLTRNEQDGHRNPSYQPTSGKLILYRLAMKCNSSQMRRKKLSFTPRSRCARVRHRQAEERGPSPPSGAVEADRHAAHARNAPNAFASTGGISGGIGPWTPILSAAPRDARRRRAVNPRWTSPPSSDRLSDAEPSFPGRRGRRPTIEG